MRFAPAYPRATVVNMLADGVTDANMLAACPDLEADDIHESLRYAAGAVRARSLPRLQLADEKIYHRGTEAQRHNE
jgi:hypothetical protein